MNFIITLDIGTSGTRASVYDENGKSHFTTIVEYHTDFIYPNKVEQNPLDWKNATKSTLKRVGEYIRKEEIRPLAISITSQRASLIPVNKNGIPLHNAIMWQDKRTISECEEMKKKITMEELYNRTGLRLSPYAVVPRILWLKNRQPEIFQSAYKLIGVQDYVTHFLTGEFKTDWSQAARTMLMDIREFKWADELLELAGVTVEKLADLIPPGSVAGHLIKEVADDVGIEPGLPVILAGGDQQTAALALNVIKPGFAEANTGTGSFIIVATQEPRFDEKCRVLCSASAMPGKWINEASIYNSGSIQRWFKEEFCKDISHKENAYPLMGEEAKKAPTGSNGVMMLPHFEGSAAPYWEAKAKGTFFNLSLGTKRSHLIRAIFEGVTMEISDNISLLEQIGGKINEVSIAGGMSISDLFAQMQADSLNIKTVRFKNSEASSLGAAMSAMVTLGIYPDYEKASEKMLGGASEYFYPDQRETDKFKIMRNRKKKLFKALQAQGIYDEFMGVI
jgi:xylulokinase/glycerol kinase